MKFFKYYTSSFLAILLVLFSMAQRKPVRSLKVGDTVPDLEIKHIVNYTKSSLRMSDFGNKLLILDFWATWCAPCVASFPKMDSLQKRFDGKIQILPVTQEDKSKVQPFLSRVYKNKNVLPPSVTNDSILRLYFRHSYLPHYVWINGDMKVIAITEEKDVNQENIERALVDGNLNAQLKNDRAFTLIHNNESKLFTSPSVLARTGNSTERRVLGDSDLKVYSLLTGYVEGLVSGAGFGANEIAVSNATVSTLYKIALNGNSISSFNSNNFIIDIPDSAIYEIVSGKKKRTNASVATGLEATHWKRKNAFSYELRVPKSFAEQKFNIMLDDLNRFFGLVYGIEGVLQEARVKYLALIRTSNADKLASKGADKFIQSDKSFHVKINNHSLAALINTLAVPLQKHPRVINETGYNGNVDIELNCVLSDLNAVNIELAKYDLRLVEKEMSARIGVIRMKSGEK